MITWSPCCNHVNSGYNCCWYSLYIPHVPPKCPYPITMCAMGSWNTYVIRITHWHICTVLQPHTHIIVTLIRNWSKQRSTQFNAIKLIIGIIANNASCRTPSHTHLYNYHSVWGTQIWAAHVVCNTYVLPTHMWLPSHWNITDTCTWHVCIATTQFVHI